VPLDGVPSEEHADTTTHPVASAPALTTAPTAPATAAPATPSAAPAECAETTVAVKKLLAVFNEPNTGAVARVQLIDLLLPSFDCSRGLYHLSLPNPLPISVRYLYCFIVAHSTRASFNISMAATFASILAFFEGRFSLNVLTFALFFSSSSRL
jgi:hypothetical protein